MQPTPSQRKALDDSRHLAITANAGSGKTTVLVQRYLQLLETHPELTPRDIVAITFTDAAAAELRARIAKAISVRLRDTDLPAQTKRHLEKSRDSMAGAYISTIHSFAARLIRAYPVEANVDATFITLAGSEHALLHEDTMSRVLKDALQAAYDSGDENHPVLLTFRRLTRQGVMSAIDLLMKDRSRTRALTRLLEEPDLIVIRKWKATVERVLAPIRDAIPLFELLANSPLTTKGDTKRGAIEAISLLQGARDSIALGVTFREIRKYFIRKEGGVTGNLVSSKKLTSDLSVVGEQLTELYDALSPLTEKLTTATGFVDDHLDYLTLMRSVIELHDAVEIAFAEIKTEYSMLDFDDQIDRLRLLVSQPNLAHELAEQFRYILIDEYQDTDASQFDIARGLTLNFGTENKIAVVGDPKQSIYAFRNADVEIFDETRRLIESQKRSALMEERARSLGMTHSEAAGALTLAESFRMADRPLAFINRLFGVLLSSDGGHAAQADYTPLVAARDGSVSGTVEWLLYEAPVEVEVEAQEEFNSSEEEFEAPLSELDEEAGLIARKIRAIVDGRDERFINDEKIQGEDKWRPAAYGDFAVLLRERKGLLTAIEAAFVRYDIPYNVRRGKGFFDQQEVLDLISYLRFLLNPKDDVSLFATLRSPLFAMSDTLLFEMHVATDNIYDELGSHASLWNRLIAFAGMGQDEVAVRAVAQLSENLQLVGRTESSTLLTKILKETALMAILLALENGDQAAANVEKFISLARQHDTRGLSTVYDFVTRMQDLVQREEDEPQANLGTSDSVHLMTIHGAKGLEFPIVIVAGLNKKYSRKPTNVIDSEYGLLLNPKRAPKPAITTLLEERATSRTNAEEKRILYVAMTRARDHLILSAVHNKKSKGTYLDLCMTALGLSFTETIAPSILISESIQRYDAATEVTRPEHAQFEVPITRTIAEPAPSVRIYEDDEPATIGGLHLQHYPAAKGLGRFSPSQLLTYVECPTKYYLRYILGLPDEPRLAYDLEPDELAERVKGTLLGQIIHKLFERIDKLRVEDALDERAFEIAFGYIADGFGLTDLQERSRYRERAFGDLSRFLASDLAREVFEARYTRTEYSVHAALTELDHVRGIIDRFFISAGGEHTVLDYKTDTTPGSQNPKKRERYGFQLRFYAYLVSLLYPEATKVRALLYYTASGEIDSHEFDRESFRGIEATLATLIADARALEKTESLDGLLKNREHCHECPFFEGDLQECVAVLADQNPTDIPAR